MLRAIITRKDNMKSKRAAWILLAAAFLLLLVPPLSAAELMAGAGKADLTPPRGMPLSGYGDRANDPSTGVHDRVYARALVLEWGGVRAAMVCADILMVTRELRESLLQRLSDLDLDFLSVSATHTHYSIGAYVDNKVAEMAVMGKYDPRALEMVVSAMEEAVRAAASDMRPALIGSGRAGIEGVSINRRHAGGPVDPYIRVLGAWSEDGDLIAAAVHHAVHPTALPSRTTLVSGDVAGLTEALLEERHPGSVVMFLNGGLGDQGPGLVEMEDGWEKVDIIGRAMADKAGEVLAGIEPKDCLQPELYERTFHMPGPRMRFSLECWLGLNQLFPVLGRSMIREEGLLMGLELGDALLFFSPAEITYEIQKRLEESYPEDNVFVVSHSNDYYGYVVTPEDYKSGGYETCMNFYGPRFGVLLEAEFRAMAGP